jgi:NAD-dependent dihydropyrimidine dehydrogenase PreA subunit
MAAFRFAALTVVQTLLRVLPFPCRTGLVRIGNPGRDAPVLLTCNFRLTVERVKRALRGVDAYLLVANSRGVNVWCAATGGLLTDHDVISVIKTSGVDALVDHRRVVLPQLAATGIEGKVVHDHTGWRVAWGPAAAADIPAYVRGGFVTTPAMRRVAFRWPQRLEMAVAWAFPLSLGAALLLLPLWRSAIAPVVGLTWLLALALFMAFPLYERRLRAHRKRVGFVFFDFGRRGVTLVVWLLVMAAIVASLALERELSWAPLLRWGVVSLVVVLVLSLDLAGSTPVYKSGLLESAALRIELDEARCKGAAFCEQVCPTDVFVVDPRRKMAAMPRAEWCVSCGACIVQCPFDALYFAGPDAEVVEPETVRRYKLNMLGKRRRAATKSARVTARPERRRG